MIHKPHLFHALIVAVDKYDDEDIKELKSPVTDACQVLRWLHALGVPPENIICHVASSSPHKDRLDEVAVALETRFTAGPRPEAGAVRLVDARRESIVDSVSELLHLSVESDDPPVESDDPPVESDDPPVESDDPPVESDDPSVESASLIVFLLGHGFMLPKRSEPTSRVFITQDYTKAITNRNIAMGDLMDTLLYTASFGHVTVVFDACSTQPYGAQQRETVTPNNLQLDLGDPNVATGVALCSASGQLELAQDAVVDGKGSVFLAAFLEATESIEDDYIEFEGEDPVIDLRRVMARHVIPRVQATASQNPALVPIGAYTESQGLRGCDPDIWPIPLYRLDRKIDKVTFCRERRAREIAGGGREAVGIALDRRHLVARIRGLRLEADRFREAALHANEVPKDAPGRRPLIDGLLAIEADLRSQTEGLGAEEWEVPPDVTGKLRDGQRDLELAVEYGDRAHRPDDDDPLAGLVSASRTYQKCLRHLRLAMEVAYTNAVWEALRNVVRYTEGLDADRAVRTLGQWVAVADAPLLSAKADAIASRIGTDDGSLGLLLLRQHGRLEHDRSWITEGVDQYSEPTAGDSTEGVLSQVADALVGDAAPPLQEAIRRLLDIYPAVSDHLDRKVLEALSRRAGSSTWRATG